MQLTCPACGLTFETEARTNTRCRRCRKVVSVARQAAARAPLGTSSVWSGEGVEQSGQTFTGAALIGLGASLIAHRWSARPSEDMPLGLVGWSWCALGAGLVVAGIWVLVRNWPLRPDHDERMFVPDEGLRA